MHKNLQCKLRAYIHRNLFRNHLRFKRINLLLKLTVIKVFKFFYNTVYGLCNAVLVIVFFKVR